MKIELCIQNKGENLIKDKIYDACDLKPKKAYFFMGNMKDTGFEILNECLEDLKARKFFVIGIDKKNTTKNMLEKLCKYTKNVYIFNNNNLVELDVSTIVFEYADKAEIFILSGNISEGGIKDNIAIYTKITYSLEKDKKEYEEYINKLLEITKYEECSKIDKESVKLLIEQKQIFTTKQFTHSVMSISELLESKVETTKKENLSTSIDVETEAELEDTDDVVKEKIPSVDLSSLEDFSIDIDVDELMEKEQELIEKEEVTKNQKKVKNEEKKESKEEKIEDLEEQEFDLDSALDIESLLFEKSDIRLDQKVIGKKVADKEIAEQSKGINKKIDLSKVSNLIMQLPSKPTKGKEVSVIKVPNYIKDMVPNMFEILEKSKTQEKSDGIYKIADIKVEIVDVKAGNKYNEKANIIAKQGRTYLTIESDSIQNILYSEEDIVRIIKLSDNVYHIEIVSKDMPEYKIWKKMCNQNFKGSSRSFGVM